MIIKKKYNIISQLNIEDLKILKVGLYELSQEYRLLDDKSKIFIKKHLKENKFFIQKINGDINENLWGLNHLICQIISEEVPELKESLLNELNSIKTKYKSDKSCVYRVESLIRQYGLDIKKEEK